MYLFISVFARSNLSEMLVHSIETEQFLIKALSRLYAKRNYVNLFHCWIDGETQSWGDFYYGRLVMKKSNHR